MLQYTVIVASRVREHTLKVDNVSPKAIARGLIVAMIVVLELPPNESCKVKGGLQKPTRECKNKDIHLEKEC